jgi:hypothetical protein
MQKCRTALPPQIMSIDTTITNTNTAVTAFLGNAARSQQASPVGSVFGTSTGAPVLQTANTAIFQMANLVGRVRSMSRQAGMLSASNTSGVDALRTQVNQALSQFNEIAKTMNMNGTLSTNTPPVVASGTASTNTTTNATTAAPSNNAPPESLDDLRSTLAGMQTSLHDNVGKLGHSIQTALAYDSQLTNPAYGPVPNASTFGVSSANSLASLWAKLYSQRAGSSQLL